MKESDVIKSKAEVSSKTHDPDIAEQLFSFERQQSEKLNQLIDSLKEKKTRKAMGIGVIGRPNTIFPRQFRWTLEGNVLKEHYLLTVSSDYVKKQLKFNLIEFMVPGGEDCMVDVWIKDVISRRIKEDLTLTTYDGCGVPLYNIVFSKIKIIEHHCPYDYASSEIVTHEIIATFSKADRTFLLKDKNDTKTS